LKTVYLSLGGNVGDRKKFLEEAVSQLQEKCGKLIAVSSFYETEPWGFQSENAFLNIAVKLQTQLEIGDFHDEIQKIEIQTGRKRNIEAGYTDRTVDIDILYFGKLKLSSENLTIPHPRIAERKFVLIPLLEIAEITGNQSLQNKVKSMLGKCTDNSKPVKL
jgi:2-amino-4-hydroxy-6-hydroxymethyldihydropteridine diphosphokinase